VVLAALCFLASTVIPCAATAEGISGYLDLGYSNFNSETEDALGNVNRLESTAIHQRYNLMFSRSLSPYLRLYANGLFDKVDSRSVINGAWFNSTTTTIQPTVDMTLRSPVYLAGVKFNRRVETSTTNATPAMTTYIDFFQGLLGWKPPDRYLPSAQLRLTRTHGYDRERISRDVVSDVAQLAVEYTPTDTVSIRYRPSYIVTENRLAGLETQSQTHAGTVQYSDRLLQDRITFGMSYNFAFNELQVSVRGTGTVDIEQVRFAGLSSIDDTPGDGTLDQNAALMDGNVTASAGPDIGLPPFGGDERERNIGLDFAFAKEVNTLLLWVDKPLPIAISNSFSWSVYTSADNVTWSFLTTVFPAAFGTIDNRFEIGFSPVNTRYIKVVVKPLSPAVIGASGFPDIFVTELQAFSRKPADQVRGKTTSSSQVFSFDGRALLLEKNPNLYYQVTYFLQTSEPSSQQKWTLYNGLQANHRFNKVISGIANVGREDFDDSLVSGYGYLANMSLDAVPIRALHHTFSYSGRIVHRDDGSLTTNNYYLNNTVNVYTGVFLTAEGGLNYVDSDTGRDQKSTILSGSVSVEPHRKVGLNYRASTTYTEITGGGSPDSSFRRTDNTAGATYHPVETLYLVFGWTMSDDQKRTHRLQHYGLDWSPYLGSALQFAFTYTETLSSIENAKTRLWGPSMTLKVAKNTSLNAQYQVLRTWADTGTMDSTSFSTFLRAYF